MKISFEKNTCGRCNGERRIKAFGHVYGGICFGCRGVGTKLTRSGAYAKRAYDKAMSIPTSELEVDMIVWDTDHRRKIASINPSTTHRATTTNGENIPMVEVTFVDGSVHHMSLVGFLGEPTTVKMALSPTNRHLAIEALAKLRGATITETEEVTA